MKICPRYKEALLTLSNVGEVSRRINDGDACCDQQQGEWWDEKHERCCIKTLAQLKVSGLVTTHQG